ncbi:MAG TPA: cytidylyltransferase [Candidatus Ozemobacteraceae bacterium]
MIAALILGRKGSVGFPGKNLFPVLGRPLSWYPMNAAKNAKLVDRVYLSTDDERLMELARQTGVEVIERPAYLCTKEALGEDAYKHGYEEICRRLGQRPELMVLLFCNAATLLPETIDEGITILRNNASYDSAVTVSRYNMWSPLRARKIGPDGLLHPFIPHDVFESKTLNCDRDSQGDSWFADVAVSVVRPDNLEHLEQGLLPQKWMGQKIYPLKQEAGCDVDYEWQIPVVEWWLKKHGFTAA